jgi:hypothetical protein
MQHENETQSNYFQAHHSGSAVGGAGAVPLMPDSPPSPFLTV